MFYTADLYGGHFSSVVGFNLENLDGISYLFPGAFVSKVRISHFPFSRILCVL